MNVQHASRLEVRRLREHDGSRLAAFLNTEPGYNLFLTSNLEQYGLRNSYVRFWAALAPGQLRAVLMMVERRGAFFAPDVEDVRPLVEVAEREQLSFTMGRRELIDAVLATSGRRVERREEHRFCELRPVDLRLAALEPPLGVTIRRATGMDIERLTAFYLGTAGFEHLSEAEVRRSMIGRVHHLRTYVAEKYRRLLSAASTSAEGNLAVMIGGVWTAPDARDHGYSTAVVARLADEVLRTDRNVYLFYLEDNPAAARVYEKIGFRIIGKWSVAYLA
jgi:predicted GNAT family acetyltransferase